MRTTPGELDKTNKICKRIQGQFLVNMVVTVVATPQFPGNYEASPLESYFAPRFLYLNGSEWWIVFYIHKCLTVCQCLLMRVKSHRQLGFFWNEVGLRTTSVWHNKGERKHLFCPGTLPWAQFPRFKIKYFICHLTSTPPAYHTDFLADFIFLLSSTTSASLCERK